MSCIVGIKDVENNSVYIGSDSIVTAGEAIVYPNYQKVFLNRNLIIGVVGSVSISDVVKDILKKPPYALGGSTSSSVLLDEFPNLFKNMATDKGLIQTSDLVEGMTFPYFDGELLISNGQSLFRLHSTFDISEIAEPYCAIGRGDDVATGVMFSRSTPTVTDPEDILFSALAAAYRYSVWVRPPFLIYKHKEGERPVLSSTRDIIGFYAK